ncbi:MAG: hypothetical protein ACYTHK_12305 [Planctomycetota bacterium]|jgi:hypothetical protein
MFIRIGSVRSRMRAIEKSTTPWTKYEKRKLDRRAPDDPLRKVRLRARGRRFLRDSNSTKRVDTILVIAMAVMAMSIGYRIAHYLDFDMAGTVLSPFVVVGLAAVFWGRMPLGARLIGLALGLGFLLWPVLT